jgi:peptidoglycan-associated lipoprotein
MDRPLTSNALLLVLGALLALTVATGCPPSYPKCASDDNCKSTNPNEVCVEGFCKQCRDDAQCNPNGTKPCMQCAGDRTCQKRFKCCTSDLDCPGEKCWPHLTDASRPGECGDLCMRVTCPPGQKCDGGACVPDGCVSDDQCPPGNKCIEGKCVEQVCDLQPVYFDYDQSRIRLDQEAALQANAECLKKRALAASIEGHCDERGDAEYNLALGQRRANAVKRQYKTRGVQTGDLSTISYGKERPTCSDSGEECWSKNRRAETVAK